MTWGMMGAGGEITAARVQLPRPWAGARTAMPASTVQSAPGGTWSSAIDDLGNALIVTNYPLSTTALANTTARLAATDDQWTQGTILNSPPDTEVAVDSPAGFTLAGDDSATAAFMRREPRATTLHVASTAGQRGQRIGGDSTAATIPCLPATCSGEWEVRPAVRSLVRRSLSSRSPRTPASSSCSPGQARTLDRRSLTFEGFGSTLVYLRSAHVRKGYTVSMRRAPFRHAVGTWC